MKQKKNIDRLFQEKFKNFEAHPSDQVWENIVKAKKEKEDRKIVPIWWRLGGIAAVILLLVTIGTALLTNTSKTTNTAPELVESNQKGSTNQPTGVLSTTDTDSSTSKEDDSGLVTENSTTEESTSTDERIKENNTLSGVSNTQGAVVVSQDKTTVIQDQITINKERTGQRSIDNTETSTKSKTEDIASSKQPDTNTSQKQTDLIDPTVKINKGIDDAAVAVSEEKTTDASQNTEIEEESKKSLVDEAARIVEANAQDDDTQVKEAIANRWNVGAVAAPVFYGDFGGSGIDPQFKDNAKTSNLNLSYGVQVSYAVTPKFKVRTGVSNVDLNYNTQDISFTPSNSARTLRGIDFSQSASFLDITDRVNPSSATPGVPDGLGQGGNTVSSGEIQQNVGYIEIPLEAIYVLSDKRLGVELIGGVSTLVLNNNEIFLESNGLRTNLGTSNALNDVSFTTNIGLGLNYKVTEKVKVNIEPSLKYQLNAYNNSVGEFKPYYVGLYTGVNYRF
ncbi:hypothetical protein [uncultured Dokdonia sp.]|uniref:outer membrane beta-barrel protein n=1 Tax=uncultured Dokdonia sp. TaxID=575653 RepID=UPI0026076A79|nr:hypothetical protein [uncultured Dokdonia sp.]